MNGATQSKIEEGNEITDCVNMKQIDIRMIAF